MILVFRQSACINSPELVLLVSSIWSSQNIGLEMFPILKAAHSQADVLPAGAQGGDWDQIQNPLKEKPFDFNALQLRALLLEREKLHTTSALSCCADSPGALQGKSCCTAMLHSTLAALILQSSVKHSQMMRRISAEQDNLGMWLFTLLCYLV